MEHEFIELKYLLINYIWKKQEKGKCQGWVIVICVYVSFYTRVYVCVCMFIYI